MLYYRVDVGAQILIMVLIINAENIAAAEYIYIFVCKFFFSGSLDEKKLQNNSIYLKYRYFVTFQMSLWSFRSV